jgi:hypothetical protein
MELFMIIPAAENLHLSQESGGVRIPLEYNRNDKGSLFAGSIYAGAVMAGYRYAEELFAAMKISGALVAKEARIRYFKQILSDGFAVASADSTPIQKPNGNYTLDVTIIVSDSEGRACAELNTEYVLLAPR